MVFSEEVDELWGLYNRLLFMKILMLQKCQFVSVGKTVNKPDFLTKMSVISQAQYQIYQVHIIRGTVFLKYLYYTDTDGIPGFHW